MSREAGGHLSRIVLIGFMGSGKTTVSALIGRALSLPVVDVDALVEREAGCDVPQIFADWGEAGFRERETAVLRRLLDAPPCVISCGGGVCTEEANRELLPRLGVVIYLEVSADEALARITDPSTRPNLAGREQTAALLASRRADYERCATFSIDTSGKTPEEVCASAVCELRRRGVISG